MVLYNRFLFRNCLLITAARGSAVVSMLRALSVYACFLSTWFGLWLVESGTFSQGQFLKTFEICPGYKTLLGLMRLSRLLPSNNWRPPTSGIGNCSKTHLYINMKVLDFSFLSKTKILKKKKIWFFYPTPTQRGVLKKWKFWKLVREPKL